MACPAYSGGSISQPTCYNDGASINCPSATWDRISQDGTTYSLGGTPAASNYLLYDSYSVLGRICIPTTAIFSNVFSTLSSSFTSATSSGDLGNFISDIKNVQIYLFRIGCGY